MEIRIAKSALEDLQAIQTYYTAQGIPHIGNDLVTAMLQHIEILQPHPDAGRIVPEFNLGANSRINPSAVSGCLPQAAAGGDAYSSLA